MAVKTITVGAGTLTIGSDGEAMALQSQVRSVKLTPKVDQDDQRYVLSGESIGGDRKESWTMEGTILQDLGHPESVTEWLWAHAGEEKPFTLIFENSRGKMITGTLTVEAIEVGGEANTSPESDFEFSVIGRPVIAPTASPAGLAVQV